MSLDIFSVNGAYRAVRWKITSAFAIGVHEAFKGGSFALRRNPRWSPFDRKIRQLDRSPLFFEAAENEHSFRLRSQSHRVDKRSSRESASCEGHGCFGRATVEPFELWPNGRSIGDPKQHPVRVIRNWPGRNIDDHEVGANLLSVGVNAIGINDDRAVLIGSRAEVILLFSAGQRTGCHQPKD